MDPNAALIALLNAFADEDEDAILAHLDGLKEWIERDGFSPVVRNFSVNPTASFGYFRIGMREACDHCGR